jgi:cytoskeletal protein CcmA (bactofilin family)
MTLAKVFPRIISIFFIVGLLTIISTTPVTAADFRTGTDVVVASGEVIEDDLYFAGATLVIDGTVDGDIFAAGQSITINGTINGGLTAAAGGTIEINGKIARGVRAAAQTVDVSGSIERDLFVAAGTVDISDSAVIGGSLMMGSQDSTVNGRVNGDIRAAANTVEINADVGGNIDITGNQITIGSSASVTGNLTYRSDNDAKIQQGAVIRGEISHKSPPPSFSPVNFHIPRVVTFFIGWIVPFLTLFVIGLILILTMPKRMTRLAEALRTQTLSSLGWGALLFFVTPIAAVLVMLTIIGIPLGIIALVLWGIAVYLSQIPVALFAGWLILKNASELKSRGIMLGIFALGLLITTLLEAIPYVGWIFGLLIAILGLGTLISSQIRPGSMRDEG